MMVSLGFLDSYPKLHHAELLRAAEMERLAELAVGPRRPLRAAIASWLLVAAEWVEGGPHASMSRVRA